MVYTIPIIILLPELWLFDGFSQSPNKYPSQLGGLLPTQMVHHGSSWFIMVHHGSSWFIITFIITIYK